MFVTTVCPWLANCCCCFVHHPSFGAALLAASVASTATLADIGGDPLLSLLLCLLLPLLGLGTDWAFDPELGTSGLPLGVEMGMFGGAEPPSATPSAAAPFCSSSFFVFLVTCGVVSTGLSFAGLSAPASTSMSPRSLPRFRLALSELSLSCCCSLLSPTPAIPDPLPGVLSRECDGFESDMVRPQADGVPSGYGVPSG